LTSSALTAGSRSGLLNRLYSTARAAAERPTRAPEQWAHSAGMSGDCEMCCAP
jgi:hypothetical protein